MTYYFEIRIKILKSFIYPEKYVVETVKPTGNEYSEFDTLREAIDEAYKVVAREKILWKS